MSGGGGGEGFHYGHGDDGLVWLRRSADGRYKKIHPELLEVLLELHHGRLRQSQLDEPLALAIDALRQEGYLVTDAPLIAHQPPPDIRIWPRAALFFTLLAALVAVVALRFDVAWPPPADPLANLWAIPFFFFAASLHELGHWAACRPYFRPKIRLGLLNRVFPALVTMTNDAWSLPRNIRLWINLAGPTVDLALTLLVAAVHLLWFEEMRLLSTLLMVQLMRILFVFNPLIEGDGYWILVDLTGKLNLRSRGWRDLTGLRWSGAAAFTAAAIVFTLGSLGFYVVVGLRFLGVV